MTFRTTITLAVMGFITILAASLIVVQILTFHAAARDAASAAMDAASANALGRLEAELSEVGSLVRVLAASPYLGDSDDRSEVGAAVGLFKTTGRTVSGRQPLCRIRQWMLAAGAPPRQPQPAQRRRLEAPDSAVYNVNLVRPTAGGALPMRRVFEDDQGNKIEQLDLWDYGYDARKRSWYRDTLKGDRPLVSSPYLSFSIAVPMITLSAPLQGRVRGVVAVDIKLDKFSDFVNAQRPGKHGSAVIFDTSGMLLAHPDFAQFVDYGMTHPSHPELPDIREIRGGMVAAVIRGWNGSDHDDGRIGSQDGREYFYRLRKFSFGRHYDGYLLLLAAEEDFVENVRSVQIKGIILALVVGGCFLPGVWIFGGRMSASLKRVTAQAGRLHTLSAPDDATVTSHIAEIHELGSAMAVARRAIWSFAHFVPKDIVKGIIDGSISTELGGVRQEVTILFTDVRNFTGIAETADPDILMRQTSRHFGALTEAFLAEGGTVDKFIGDAVMAFWNAPYPQPDHAERACRAALSAKARARRSTHNSKPRGYRPSSPGLAFMSAMPWSEMSVRQNAWSIPRKAAA
jgi:adenylate cyclase